MIGIFDSGVGGLTVAKETKKRNPGRRIIYFGDTARVPWGNKSPELIRKYSEEICDFLVSKGAREIVIACNTASALAGDFLKEKYPNVKIYDVIEPVIEKISAENLPRGSIIAVIGTRGTVSSGVYEKKIKEAGLDLKVLARACPLFVPIVEEGWGGTGIAKMVADEYLHDFKAAGIDRIILGCTHYPILRGVINSYFEEKVGIISSDEEVAKKISAGETEDADEGDRFYFSDLSESYLELAKNIYGEKIKAEKIDL